MEQARLDQSTFFLHSQLLLCTYREDHYRDWNSKASNGNFNSR